MKAAAVFDGDTEGSRERGALVDEMRRLRLTELGLKAITLSKPPRLVDLAKRGFRIRADLESYYSDELWSHAERAGWLEPIDDLTGLLSNGMVNEMANGGSNPFSALDAKDTLRLKFAFSSAGKQKASRRLAGLTGAAATRELHEFRPLVIELRTHLALASPD